MEHEPLDGFVTPASSWPESGYADRQMSQWTPQRVQSKRTNVVELILQQVSLAIRGFLAPGSGFSQLNQWGTSTEDRLVTADLDIIALDGRVTALEGGGVVTTYTVSGTWTNPSPSVRKSLRVIVVNGGDGGWRCAGNIHDQAKGGQSGGYQQRTLFTDELPATVAMTIGAAGAGATSGGRGGVGAVSSFGSFVVGAKGVGAIYAGGSYSTGIPPGDGGGGVYQDSTDGGGLIPSGNGEGGPFAPGGFSGFGTTSAACNGLPGASAPVNIPSGGGGGGGGSATNVLAVLGDGGPGGFPGGGGGGGARNATNFGDGGNGGAGCIYIIEQEES